MRNPMVGSKATDSICSRDWRLQGNDRDSGSVKFVAFRQLFILGRNLVFRISADEKAGVLNGLSSLDKFFLGFLGWP